MWNWLRELYELRAEYRERKFNLALPCEACEVLKTQLERANYEREQLINHLLKPPAPPDLVKPVPVTQPLNVRHMPFRVKQQILEAESREEARIMREHRETMKKADEQLIKEGFKKVDSSSAVVQVDTSPQVEELERELGIQ